MCENGSIFVNVGGSSVMVDDGEREGLLDGDEGVSNLSFRGIACSSLFSLFSRGKSISGNSSSLTSAEDE